MALDVIDGFSLAGGGRLAIAKLNNPADYYSHVNSYDPTTFPYTESPVTILGENLRTRMAWTSVPIGGSSELVLADGSKIVFKATDNYNAGIYFYNALGGGVYSQSTARSVYLNDNIQWHIAFARDDATQKGYLILIRNTTDTQRVTVEWNLSSSWLDAMYSFGNGAESPTYNWIPMSQLNSDHGNLTLTQLTVEKSNAGYIPFSVYSVDYSSNFQKLSNAASIRSMINRMHINDEVTLAWAGDNECKLKYAAHTSNSDTVELHYYINGDEQTGIATSLTLNNDRKDYWFGFLIDTSAGVATQVIMSPLYVAPLAQYQTYIEDGSYSATQADARALWYKWLQGHYFTTPTDGNPLDHYNPTEPTEDLQPGGPITETVIGVPDIPTVTALDTGFIKMYNPTDTEVRQIAQEMNSSDFLDVINDKIYGSMLEIISGLMIIPVTPSRSTNKQQVRAGNIACGNVESYAVTTQYVKCEYTPIYIPKDGNNYLDYAPYTKVQIYLPFIGYRDLDVDEVVGKTIYLSYVVDILSGQCMAFITSPNNSGVQTLRYQFAGQCGTMVPLTNTDYTRSVDTAVSIAGSAVTAMAAVATGGAGAGVLAASGSTTALSSVINSKPTVNHGGLASGSAGMISQRQPFIILVRPNPAIPANMGKFKGYGSMITVQALNQLSGYFEVDSIHVEGLSATDAEKSEIENLLRGGVII